MIFLAGVFFLGWGLLCIFAKDMVWDWTVQSRKMEGVVSERTDEWDLMATIGGVVCILLGLFALYTTFNGG
jgi:hypothetical protein